jgi:hypothetical protein
MVFCPCVLLLLQVRDFGLVFDALTHFEESLLAAKMAAAGDDGEEAPPPEVRPGVHMHRLCAGIRSRASKLGRLLPWERLEGL